MFIVSTLLHGVFSQREFVRESDARVCFWNFIAVQPDDGEGDEFNRNGTDHNGQVWGVTFLTREVEQTSSPEDEKWRTLEGMVCALTPSTYSVKVLSAPLNDHVIIVVRDESDRVAMRIESNINKDTIIVKVRKGWNETRVLFAGTQYETLSALDAVRTYFALRG